MNQNVNINWLFQRGKYGIKKLPSFHFLYHAVLLFSDEKAEVALAVLPYLLKSRTGASQLEDSLHSRKCTSGTSKNNWKVSSKLWLHNLQPLLITHAIQWFCLVWKLSFAGRQSCVFMTWMIACTSFFWRISIFLIATKHDCLEC